MKVTINPLALSSLLNDLSVGFAEAEGMLLGKISKSTSTTMGDHDVDDVRDSFRIDITGHFGNKTGDHCELTDNVVTYLPPPASSNGVQFSARSQYSTSLERELKDSFVVGWFRFSSRSVQSPISPSIHDVNKHKLLVGLLPKALRPAFVFLSLTESFNQDCGVGIKGFDRALFRVTLKDALRANCERIDLLVPNLGDTDAGKRYLAPRVDVVESAGDRLEKDIVRAQRSNLENLKLYSHQQVEHCKNSLSQYLDLYESTEGPLIREIQELELRLRGNSVVRMPSVQVTPRKIHPIFATDSVTEITASSSKDDIKDLNDNDSLPSPSISGIEKGSSFDWGESPDIIQATQFQPGSPLDVVPETQIEDDSQRDERNGTDSILDTFGQVGRDDKFENMDIESGKESRSRGRPKKTDLRKTDSKKAEPENTELQKTEPKKTEKKKTEPKEEPKKTEPQKTDLKKTEMEKTEPKEERKKLESKKANTSMKRKDEGSAHAGKSSKRRPTEREKSPSI